MRRFVKCVHKNHFRNLKKLEFTYSVSLVEVALLPLTFLDVAHSSADSVARQQQLVRNMACNVAINARDEHKHAR